MQSSTRPARARAAAASLVLLLAVLQAGAWTEDPPDQATLEVTTDVEALVVVGGVLVARCPAGETVALTVPAGEHVVWLLPVDALGMGTRREIELDPDDTEELEVELEDEVEEWLDEDVEDRSPRPWESRLVPRVDGTLADPETGLEWVWGDNGADVDWEGAAAYCSDLERAGGGWRLPTVEELETLVDDDGRGDLRVLTPVAITACCPWTSEEHGSISSWYMGFDAGRRGFVNRAYSEGARALCVRGSGGGS